MPNFSNSAYDRWIENSIDQYCNEEDEQEEEETEDED